MLSLVVLTSAQKNMVLAISEGSIKRPMVDICAAIWPTKTAHGYMSVKFERARAMLEVLNPLY